MMTVGMDQMRLSVGVRSLFSLHNRKKKSLVFKFCNINGMNIWSELFAGILGHMEVISIPQVYYMGGCYTIILCTGQVM